MGGTRRKHHNNMRRKKRRFINNCRTNSHKSAERDAIASDQEERPSPSISETHKIAGVSSETSNENGFRIIDIDILCGIIAKFTLCSKCLANTLSLKELNTEKKRMSYKLQLHFSHVISSMDFTLHVSYLMQI